jgi:hypothetical protein
MRGPGRKRPGGFRELGLIGLWVALVVLASVRDVRADPVAAEDSGQASKIEAEASEAPDFEWGNLSRADRIRARQQLRALRRALPDFSRSDRRLLLLHARSLPSEERRSLRARLRGIESLEEEQRKAFEEELRGRIASMAERGERFEANVRRWKQMPEAERDKLREQMRRFRNLPLDERRALLDEWVPREETR